MTEAGTFAELLDELRARKLDAGAYASLIALFRSFDGARIRISRAEVDRHARRDLALHLLDARTPRACVRDRLVHAFGVTTRTAQRDIAAALTARRPPLPTRAGSHCRAEPAQCAIHSQSTPTP